MNNMNTNYSMIQGHNFVSPLRGATTTSSAAVPHQTLYQHTSLHQKRDMSSSPYMQKKRSEVSLAFIINLNEQKVNMRGGQGVGPSNHDYSEDDLNRMVSYNLIRQGLPNKYSSIVQKTLKGSIQRFQIQKNSNLSVKSSQVEKSSRKLAGNSRYLTLPLNKSLEHRKAHR